MIVRELRTIISHQISREELPKLHQFRFLKRKDAANLHNSENPETFPKGHEKAAGPKVSSAPKIRPKTSASNFPSK